VNPEEREKFRTMTNRIGTYYVRARKHIASGKALQILDEIPTAMEEVLKMLKEQEGKK